MTFIIGRDQILILLKWALLFRYPLTYMVFQKLYIGEVIVKASLETVVQQSTSNDNEAGSCSKAMKLKVTLRKSNSKFLFAVVEGAFVDFLLGLLEIPLGTVIGKLLNGNSSLESLENLFASISTMNVAYIKSQDLMNVLLQPQLAWNHVSQNFFSLDASKGSATISRTPIGSKKKADLKYKNPKDCGGLVKALPKFLLTDEFVLTPLSCISTISMLKKLKVPLNDIVEHEVSIGIEEGLKILKASLKSSSILTEALLKGKAWKFDNSSEPE